jgi:hypothetical protein
MLFLVGYKGQGTALARVAVLARNEDEDSRNRNDISLIPASFDLIGAIMFE